MEQLNNGAEGLESQEKYSQMLASLQGIVSEISSDSSDLDDLVSKVEKGYGIIKVLQQRLDDTKMKVESLRQDFEGSSESAS